MAQDGITLACSFSPWHMLPEESWQTIAACGLVLSGIAGVTSGPWAALAFTVLYGAAILSVLRLM